MRATFSSQTRPNFGGRPRTVRGVICTLLPPGGSIKYSPHSTALEVCLALRLKTKTKTYQWAGTSIITVLRLNYSVLITSFKSRSMNLQGHMARIYEMRTISGKSVPWGILFSLFWSRSSLLKFILHEFIRMAMSSELLGTYDISQAQNSRVFPRVSMCGH